MDEEAMLVHPSHHADHMTNLITLLCVAHKCIIANELYQLLTAPKPTTTMASTTHIFLISRDLHYSWWI